MVVAEKVDTRFSYWDELINSNKVTKEQAERLIALTKEHRLSFDGYRISPDEKSGVYGTVCEIYLLMPRDAQTTKGFKERRIKLSEIWLTFDLGLKSEQNRPIEKRVKGQPDVPQEIINFLKEGMQEIPYHWNPRSMALYEVNAKDVAAKF